MKLVIERAALLAALDAAAEATARDETIPILQNVLLEAQPGKGGPGTLVLTSTDMDRAIVARAKADIETPGAVTVPTKMLRQIVVSLEDGAQVAIEGEDGVRARLRSGRSNFTLGALPVDDFPKMASGELPHEFEIDAQDLRRIVGVPAYAVSNEETRFYLNGIFLEHKIEGRAKNLYAVATDGHRLCRLRVTAPKGAERMPGVILPQRTVAIVARLLRDAKGDMPVAMSDSRIRFTIGDVTIVSKLIDAAFPDYSRVIREATKAKFDLPVKAAIAALKRIQIVSTEKSRRSRWNLTKGMLALDVKVDGRVAEESLDIGYGGEPILRSYNSLYAVETLSQIAGKDVAWDFGNDTRDVALIEDSGDPDVLHLLMPLFD